MIDLKQLKFHAPCLVSDKFGVEQLETRIADGYCPIVMIREPLSQQTQESLASLLKNSSSLKTSFSVTRKQESSEFYSSMFSFIRQCIQELHSGQILPVIRSEFGTVVERNTNPTSPFMKLNSMVSAKEYLFILSKIIEQINELREIAEAQGLQIGFENKITFNYIFLPDEGVSDLEPDPHPRWEGKWSALPNNPGAL